MKQQLISNHLSSPACTEKVEDRRSYCWLQIGFWALLSFFWLGMNFLPGHLINGFPVEGKLAPYGKASARIEQYNPDYARQFRSIDDLYTYAKANSRPGDQREMLEIAARILRSRFVHAYGVYTLDENWMAVLAGHYIWRDLSAKVIADDILKGEGAACSQVSIVFMEFCRRIGVPTRKVALNGHYAMEARVGTKWLYFDIDLKPDFSVIGGRKSLDEILASGHEYALYENTIADSANIRRIFSQVSYGIAMEAPAPRAELFHTFTKVLSHWGWIVPFALSILCFARANRRRLF